MRLRRVIGLFLLFICFFTYLGLNPNTNPKNLVVTRAEVSSEPIRSDNLTIEISKNASAIGPNSVIEFSVELTNTLSESLHNISVALGENDSTLITTPDTDPLYTISFLDTGSTTDFQFITRFFENTSSLTSSVDLVLLIDASGSMGEEISSIKQGFENLITTLEADIPGLRMGVIIYGWNKYSENPLTNPNNYIPLTDDFESLNTFINTLYAEGGSEPWGDALYLANSWDWREDAAKLIILIGDEDCDPGIIIGEDDLLDIATNLKDQGVVISTVVCSDVCTTTVDQFQWIANYTDGTSVVLQELKSEGIELPQIIQDWTLSIAPELSKEINLTVIWQDATNTSYINSQSSSFWVDFNFPSAMIFETLTPMGINLFSVKFLVEVCDISPISFVTLYHNARGLEEVEFLSHVVNTSYYRTELLNVPSGTNLSYFVESSDILHNIGHTSKFWIIIEPKVDSLGEEVTVWVEDGGPIFTNFKTDQLDSFYLILNNIPSNDSISVEVTELTTYNSVAPVLTKYLNVNSSYWHKIYQFNLNKGNYSVILTIPNESDSFTMSYVWLTFSTPVVNEFSRSMTETIHAYGIEWTAVNGTYFSFVYDPTSSLVLLAEVYASDWTFISTFSINKSMLVTANDTYFIIVWATLRTGDFFILNSEFPTDYITDDFTDVSHSSSHVNATIYPSALLLIFLLTALIAYRRLHR